MAVLNYHDFSTLGFTTGTEGPNQFYSGPQTATGDESTHIRLDSNNPLIGSNCLRVEIVDGLYRNEYPLCRSEIRTQIYGGHPNVMQGFYSFAFKAGTLNTGQESAVISQLWDGSGGPSLSVQWRFSDNQVFIRLYNPGGSNVNRNLFVASTAWTKVVIYYQARTDSSGVLKAWVNGEEACTPYTGRTSWAGEINSTTPYWKLGLYASGFGQGNLPNRVCYFDAVSYHDDTDSESDTLEWIDNFWNTDPEPEPEKFTV